MTMTSGVAVITGKTAETTIKSESVDIPLDDESKKGRFAWMEWEEEKVFLPFISRHSGEKYISVRMAERKLLARFFQLLPQEVIGCTNIGSYYVTEAEAKLLNEINKKHSDCAFGKENFTCKDLVVRLDDATEFFKFLELCNRKLVLKKFTSSDQCGFFKINNESVVPYTVKEGVQYVPIFYFEGGTDHLQLKTEMVEGWDLAYLKFCCQVQGIKSELYANDACKVVALQEIKSHFPSSTQFEDCWPENVSIHPLHSTGRVNVVYWTRKPASQPRVSYAGGMIDQAHTVNTAALNSVNMDYHNWITTYLDYNNFQPNQSDLQQQLHLPGQLVQPQHSTPQLISSKLTQIKQFPLQQSNQPPYKLQKALIDQKVVPCINVRPYVFHDLMMTLPGFVENFFPDIPVEKCREMILGILKVVLYKGNTGHQEVMRKEMMCEVYDPVPLILVRDIMTYMPQLKYMFTKMANAKATN